jgi:hypothetical protein
VQTIEVPFKGTPEGLTALLGGHVDAVSASFGPVKDHVRAGKLRCLTFYSDHRYSDYPNVPTVVELGFPDAAKLATYVGLFIHKNTPEPIRKYLEEVAGALKRKGYKPAGRSQGLHSEAAGGNRPLGIPVIKDRVVQMAVKIVIEPIFEADFQNNSYGFRPKRNAHQAVDDVRKQLLEGRTDVIDADISKYSFLTYAALISELKLTPARGDKARAWMVTLRSFSNCDRWRRIAGYLFSSVWKPYRTMIT